MGYYGVVKNYVMEVIDIRNILFVILFCIINCICKKKSKKGYVLKCIRVYLIYFG